MSEPNSAFIQRGMPATSSPSPSQHHGHQHYEQHRHPSVLLMCVIVVSLVGNAVLITMVTLNWTPWTSENAPTPDKHTTSQSSGPGARPVCFTCDYLGPGIESNDTLYDVIRLNSDQTLCCLRQNDDVTKLFQQIITDQYRHTSIGWHPVHSKLVQRDKMTSTGAHLYLRPDSPPMWTQYDRYSTAFCSGVACREGNITIKERGRYMVYSQITVREGFGILHRNGNLLHGVKRYNPALSGLDVQLMLFSKTSPMTSSQKTYFLSAILELRSQDILWVMIAKKYYHLLDDGDFSNFFGVMKM